MAEAKTSGTTKQSAKKPAAGAASEADFFSFGANPFAAAYEDMMAKSMEQAGTAYSKWKETGESAGDLFEQTNELGQEAAKTLQKHLIDVAQENCDSALQLMKDLSASSSLAEAIELQASYTRKQFETLGTQTKAFQETVVSVSNEMAEPARKVFEKAVTE
ncbi:hypothetical protein E1162_00545 [Rhodobacteraceae bacterium RKSG542]|uniref:phasin family protein n=1 Tax=Pseudovibrio flavus TaxID=2529854 RepID=UPI0012BC0339|nr:phasin family protein [Pseudovibrio flavus]MTI15722.1 hypothetical protein [Pseudovibrio flavus]